MAAWLAAADGIIMPYDAGRGVHSQAEGFTEHQVWDFEEEKARNFEYYEALTVRDSSLSACSQAVVAADTGHLDLAYDYLAETALMDMADLEHNTRDGLHIAALTRLTFTVILRGRHLRVEVMPGHATYILDGEGPPLEITHYGSPVAVAPGKPETRDIPVPLTRPRPSQPPGREPVRRAKVARPARNGRVSRRSGGR